MHSNRILLFFLLLLVAASAQAETDLSPTERDSVFRAAGFKAKGSDYVLCEDDVTASYAPGRIESADLNRDGEAEFWVKESSVYCYGNTAEYFALVGKNANGDWTKLIAEVGIPIELESRHDGWSDIEVGGPGAGPFPTYFFDGAAYVRGR
jgi:hypothetical protein